MFHSIRQLQVKPVIMKILTTLLLLVCITCYLVPFLAIPIPMANLGDSCYIHPLKAFMDGTTIICSNEDVTCRMLERLDVLMAWCRVKFKPKKSRSLSVRKAKIDATTPFTVAKRQIPTVSQEPVKSLERWCASSMKRGIERVGLATKGLLAINRCGVQVKFKVLFLQFMLIPKLLWPLLVYEICSTTVEAIGTKINAFAWVTSMSLRCGNVLP